MPYVWQDAFLILACFSFKVLSSAPLKLQSTAAAASIANLKVNASSRVAQDSSLLADGLPSHAAPSMLKAFPSSEASIIALGSACKMLQ